MRVAALVVAVELARVLTPTQTVRPDQASASPAAIVAYLQRAIAWYRHVTAVDGGLAGIADATSRDRMHQAAVTALQLAFEFARAEAVILRSQSPAAPGGRSPENAAMSNPDEVATRLTARVASLQSQLSDVDARLQRASGKTRASLLDQRNALAAELDVNRELQNSLATIAQFAANVTLAERTTDALTSQIDELARSVPEVALSTRSDRRTTRSSGASSQSSSSSSSSSGEGASVSRPTSVPPTSSSRTSSGGVGPESTAPAWRPESAGLIALLTELFTIKATQRELDDTLRETQALSETIERYRAPLIGEVRQIVRQTDAAAAARADAAQPSGNRGDFQAAVTRVKQLSTAFVPLGEQEIAVDTAREALVTSRNGVAERTRLAGRFVLVRIALLALVIAVLLGLSEAWRRATVRYLRDARRRSQLLLVRRIVIGCAIAVVIVIGFASELGSVATYAGLLTAGLAVALQNVILSVVAYFFLIGRYGIRVGDRVTISGVTGNVIDIGLVKIHLMELIGPDWRPSGRIVVFSNAVLFQPSALFKQTPGVDYIWRTLTVTLAQETDVQHAERKLGEGVGAVYDEYREAIERQHATLQRTLDVQTPVPRPEVHQRYTTDGIEFSIRYPVERMQAVEIDRRVMAAIRQTIATDSALRLVGTTAPTVDSGPDGSA